MHEEQRSLPASAVIGVSFICIISEHEAKISRETRYITLVYRQLIRIGNYLSSDAWDWSIITVKVIMLHKTDLEENSTLNCHN